MCVMLKGLNGFELQSNDNKVFQPPFAAARDASGRRWIITAWDGCKRALGNASCPCLHADPRVPDCPPGESRSVRGWVSFYEGPDIQAELKRTGGGGVRWRLKGEPSSGEASLKSAAIERPESAHRLVPSRRDSVLTLTRRLEARLKASPELADDLAGILRRAAAPAAGINAADATRTVALERSGGAKTENKARHREAPKTLSGNPAALRGAARMFSPSRPA